MNRLHLSRIAISIVLAMAGSGSRAQDKAGLEAAPLLTGTELARAQLLTGPMHTVVEPVRVDGHLGRFVIESKFGRFPVHGANLLAVRVHELQAIEKAGWTIKTGLRA